MPFAIRKCWITVVSQSVLAIFLCLDNIPINRNLFVLLDLYWNTIGITNNVLLICLIGNLSIHKINLYGLWIVLLDQIHEEPVVSLNPASFIVLHVLIHPDTHNLLPNRSYGSLFVRHFRSSPAPVIPKGIGHGLICCLTSNVSALALRSGTTPYKFAVFI